MPWRPGHVARWGGTGRGQAVCCLQATMLYQFIFTTDEKLTIVYPIPDEMPTTLAFSSVNWCKIDVFTLNIMVLHHKMFQTVNNNKYTK